MLFIFSIQSEKTKLNNQVERILEVASLNKDALEIPVSTIEIKTVITKALSNLSLLIEKEEAVINTQIEEGILVQGNAYHLENVLVNLIENGIKYSEGKAAISITFSQAENLAQIQVRDQGIGMTNDQQDKAFDNFYRVQSGNLHDTKGFGLGLSYSKLVIEKMNGSIQLSSKPGEGTTATINLKLS